MPFAPFRQSALCHLFAAAAIWGLCHPWLHRPQLKPLNPFRHSKMVYYPISPYLPPLQDESGSEPAKIEKKGQPVYARQRIRSAPSGQHAPDDRHAVAAHNSQRRPAAQHHGVDTHRSAGAAGRRDQYANGAYGAFDQPDSATAADRADSDDRAHVVTSCGDCTAPCDKCRKECTVPADAGAGAACAVAAEPALGRHEHRAHDAHCHRAAPGGC
jgi:hypothetical protein